MFILLSGGTVFGITKSVELMKDLVAKRVEDYSRTYRIYSNSNQSFYKTQWPTESSFIARQMSSLNVIDIDQNVIEITHSTSPGLIKEFNVTDQFWTTSKTETQIGEHITAKVVKKGLKSFGKEVVIEDRVKHNSARTVAPSPVEWKELYDQMVRIVCTLPNWGKITVSPDSLDDYKVTPNMKEIATIEFVK